MAAEPTSLLLKGLCWQFADCLAWRTPEESSRRLIEAASAELGRLRNLTGAADNPENVVKLNKHCKAYCQAVMFLAHYGDGWRALKGLLLAFRKLNKLAVTADLRYWNERGFEDVPEPWSIIAELIAACLHTSALFKSEKDPTLEV